MARGRTQAAPAAAEPVEGPWALPDGWRWEKLPQAAEVCDYLRRPINNTERLTRNNGKAAEELYPYYGATGQAGVIDDFLADGDYILLGEDGAPFLDPFKAKAYAVSGRFWVNNHAHVLKGRDHLDQRLLLHWLNAIRYEPYVNGTTRLKLTQASMNEMPVPIPPLGAQQTLADRIDELFTKLDDGEVALTRAKTDLSLWRKVLLKAAVTGELTADWRAERAKSGPPAETGADLLHRLLIDRRARWTADPKNKGKRYVEPAGPDVEEQSKLPEGWTWASMAQIAWASGYGTSEKCGYEGKGSAVLRIPNIRSGLIDLCDLKRSRTALELKHGAALKPGDLLIVRTNGSDDLIGRSAVVVEPLAEGTYFASYLIRLRLCGPPAFLRWLAMAMDSPIIRAAVLASIASSAGQYNLSLGNIETFAVPIPPLREIEAVFDRFAGASGEAAEGGEILEELAAGSTTLRQSILAAAFRGDLA